MKRPWKNSEKGGSSKKEKEERGKRFCILTWDMND
ncbi:unnamed protein product [Arabidopsis halleri]